MTNDELVTLFENVRAVRGVLQIWNTQLTSATFMKSIVNITGDPLESVVSITNNSRMTAIDISSLVYSNGKVQIQNNPNLNLQKSCSVIHNVYFNYRSISRNSFDCGCEINGLFKWPLIKNFPTNCIVLYGDLIMDGSAPPFEALYRLSSVTKLYGFIRITNTNLETLGFLQNLDTIESGPDAESTIRIEHNDFLGRFDLIRLQSIKNPGFIQLLAQSTMKSIDGYYTISFCGSDKMNNPSTYCTGKLSAVNERCTRYIGDILFPNNDVWDYGDLTNYTKVPPADIRKMQQFEVIFGTILIEGTNLKNFSLPNLREIYQVTDVRYDIGYGNYNSLGQSVAMKFRRNDFLKEVSFPNLKYAHSSIMFRLNGNLTTDEDFCLKLTGQMDRIATLGLDADYDCSP